MARAMQLRCRLVCSWLLVGQVDAMWAHLQLSTGPAGRCNVGLSAAGRWASRLVNSGEVSAKEAEGLLSAETLTIGAAPSLASTWQTEHWEVGQLIYGILRLPAHPHSQPLLQAWLCSSLWPLHLCSNTSQVLSN